MTLLHDNNVWCIFQVITLLISLIVLSLVDWCAPCDLLTKKMNEMLELETDIDFAIVDVDSNIELVHTFEVKAVPGKVLVVECHNRVIV